MFISVIIVIYILVFCIKHKPEDILCLFVLLLPFHNFISILLELYAQKGIFSIWREICILTILTKTNAFSSVFRNPLVLMNLLYGTFVLLFFFGCSSDDFSSYRLFVSYFLLTVSISKMTFNVNNLNKIISFFLISSILVCISGFIQYFVVRDELHIIMQDYADDGDGFGAFKVPNWTIMGFERMAGFVAIPNAFGMVIAIAAYFSFVLFFSSEQLANRKSYLGKSMIKIAMILSIVCLLLSFSRTGWAVFIVSIMYYMYRKSSNFAKIFTNILGSLFVIIVLFCVGYFLFPESFDIFIASFNGEEQSAATRQDMVMEQYDLIDSFWGHGFGLTSQKDRVFFTESAFVNMLYEIGLPGIILWLFFFLSAYYKYRSKYLSVFSCLIPITVLGSFVQSNILQWPYVYYIHGIIGFLSNKSIMRLLNKNNIRILVFK